MKTALISAMLAMLVTGCTGLWIGTDGDRSLCPTGATDQVERQASGEMRRWT